MAAVPPQVLSVSYDQPSYAPGQTMTVTVTYIPGYSASPAQQGTATVTDSVTQLSDSLSAGCTVVSPNPVAATYADSAGRTWMPAAVTGVQPPVPAPQTAQFTATA